MMSNKKHYDSLDELEKKSSQLLEREKEAKAKVNAKANKQRIHRLIVLGAVVEKVLGSEIPEVLIPSLISYLNEAQRVIGRFTSNGGKS